MIYLRDVHPRRRQEPADDFRLNGLNAGLRTEEAEDVEHGTLEATQDELVSYMHTEACNFAKVVDCFPSHSSRSHCISQGDHGNNLW